MSPPMIACSVNETGALLGKFDSSKWQKGLAFLVSISRYLLYCNALILLVQQTNSSSQIVIYKHQAIQARITRILAGKQTSSTINAWICTILCVLNLIAEKLIYYSYCRPLLQSFHSNSNTYHYHKHVKQAKLFRVACKLVKMISNSLMHGRIRCIDCQMRFLQRRFEAIHMFQENTIVRCVR